MDRRNGQPFSCDSSGNGRFRNKTLYEMSASIDLMSPPPIRGTTYAHYCPSINCVNKSVSDSVTVVLSLHFLLAARGNKTVVSKHETDKIRELENSPCPFCYRACVLSKSLSTGVGGTRW